MTSIMMTPLDVVKIRLQTQQRKLLQNRCFLYCNGLMDHICVCTPTNGSHNNAHGQWYARPGHFNGTIDAFIKIVRSEGPLSLWSGLPPTLVMAIPGTMLYYTSYEVVKRNLTPLCADPFCSTPIWVVFTSAMTARIIAATVVSPLELIRTKMQSRNLKYKEVGVALRQLMEQRGWQGLWLGLVPTLLRDVPFSVIYWSSYESLKNSFKQTTPTTTFSFFAGSLSGTVAAVVTLPFDVVKTHRQIDIDKPKKGNSLLSSMNDIYKSQGVRGLFTGLGPRIAKVAPACAIMITSFEYGKKWFMETA